MLIKKNIYIYIYIYWYMFIIIYIKKYVQQYIENISKNIFNNFLITTLASYFLKNYRVSHSHPHPHLCFIAEILFQMIFKDFRGSIKKKFFCGELVAVNTPILIGFILLILLYLNYWKLFIIVTIYFNCITDLK